MCSFLQSYLAWQRGGCSLQAVYSLDEEVALLSKAVYLDEEVAVLSKAGGQQGKLVAQFHLRSKVNVNQHYIQ